MDQGILYGVGVGPGDPELITLKALNVLKHCRYIAFPGKNKEENIALQILKKTQLDLADKIFISCPFPMAKDPEFLDAGYRENARLLAEILDQGEDVAFLTIGDPTIYSTYMYVHKKLLDQGYEAKIINGIPSFCAAAAALGISLAEHSELLHIIPASYPVEEALSLSGTKVLMKSGSNLSKVKELLKKKKLEASMVVNCSMENEEIFRTLNDIKEDSTYLSLLIVPDNRK